MAENRVIGRDNKLPWHLSADLKRFKSLTMGHALIMGRRTFQSIGRPLPGRRIIVLTRDLSFSTTAVESVSSLEEALALVADTSRSFIAGGAEVYKQALDVAEELFLTIVHEVFHGDAHFPHIDLRNWMLVESDRRAPDQRNPYPHTFLTYERRLQR